MTATNSLTPSMNARFKGWIRLWVVLAGLSLSAVIVTIFLNYLESASTPCLDSKYFVEQFVVRIPPGVSTVVPEGQAYAFASDVTKDVMTV